jgi:fructose-1,6-bisphosphatase I
MAFLIEQAGGIASTGVDRLLDTQPITLHDHVPTFLGSKDDILEIERALKEAL